MKILITGGSGFIGTNVVDFYAKNGWEVRNVDMKRPKYAAAERYWVECDITDGEALTASVQAFAPDYIIHLAARTDLEGKTVEDYRANTVGVENILKAAATIHGLKKILITSSMLVCHTGYIPKDQHDYAPSTRYGESKVITEQKVWAAPPACDWAILRPTSMWGPWFGVPYRNFFDTVKTGMYFHIGHKSCTKTYGYIENAVYQIDQILMNPTTDETNKVFYLGDSPAIFIEEWADQIAAELGKKIPRVPFWMMRLAAFGGDILAKLGISFPMTSFRLKNMTTNNIVPLENTMTIAPKPPVDRKTGIRRTLVWMDGRKVEAQAAVASKPKVVTIITVAYNSAATIEDTIKSVLAQTYPHIEYLIIDGLSSDNTLDIIKKYEGQARGCLRWISEKDKGMYDAMNKGIQIATGDVVGILNSDDFFTSDDVIERMVTAFDDERIDATYGDIHFIQDGQPDKCVRYYSSKHFSPGRLRFGFMPAHPSFYARRSVFERAGLYRTDYKIGADYEMMVRLFLIQRCKALYQPLDFVTMRTGGASTRDINSKLQLIKEDVRACRENGIYTNVFFISLKFLFKIFELRF